MVKQALIEPTRVGGALTAGHRRCLQESVRIRMVVNDAGDGIPLPVGTVMIIHGAVNTVLRELRRTERLLVDEAPPDGPMGAFLSCRRKRLEVAAADVKVATEAGDLPRMRRAAATFDSMATATWRVQRAVHDPQARRTTELEVMT